MFGPRKILKNSTFSNEIVSVLDSFLFKLHRNKKILGMLGPSKAQAHGCVGLNLYIDTLNSYTWTHVMRLSGMC